MWRSSVAKGSFVQWGEGENGYGGYNEQLTPDAHRYEWTGTGLLFTSFIISEYELLPLQALKEKAFSFSWTITSLNRIC